MSGGPTETQRAKAKNDGWESQTTREVEYGDHTVRVGFEIEGNELLGEQIWIRLQNVIQSMDGADEHDEIWRLVDRGGQR